MPQTSWPESDLSLPNGHLDLSHVDIVSEAASL